jgi:peptide/nickel transport system ATP-binding protein
MPSWTWSTRGSIRGCALSEAAPLLEVRDLRVSFRTEDGLVRAVDGLSLEVAAGGVLGIVGESGSGKTVSMMAVMRLIRDPNAVVEGEVLYRGRDLMRLSGREMRSMRGREIAMIFQDPMTSLTPVYTVGWQIAEQLRAHARVGRKAARARAVELLREVGIPNAERRVDDYPHQFSGGMRQRVMIAIALACNPSLLIADEPTTALDVTIQAQILELMKRLRRDHGSSIVLITHDMGVVADIAERVVVMYAGRVVEEAPKASLFRDPQHPYTWGLLGSMPRVNRPRVRRLAAIPGAPPSLLSPPAGCSFAPRCAHRFELCSSQPELLERVAPGRRDACHLDPALRPAKRALTLHAETGTASA